LPTVPTYRTTGVRRNSAAPKHEYTSVDAATEVGGVVWKVLGWTPDMCQFDIEVLVWVSDETVVVGMGLLYTVGAWFDRSVDEQGATTCTRRQQLPPASAAEAGGGVTRQPRVKGLPLHMLRSYRVELVRTALKPSTAHALLRLAGLHQLPPGAVVVDPCAGTLAPPPPYALALHGLAWCVCDGSPSLGSGASGCGTLPLEAAGALGAFALGGDVDDAAMECAAANVDAAECAAAEGVVALVRWTVRRLPLRVGCADVAVTDLPFGVHCKVQGVRRDGLYAWVAREVKPRPRFVVMAPPGRSHTGLV
jgi:hypothetical protein